MTEQVRRIKSHSYGLEGIVIDTKAGFTHIDFGGGVTHWVPDEDTIWLDLIDKPKEPNLEGTHITWPKKTMKVCLLEEAKVEFKDEVGNDRDFMDAAAFQFMQFKAQFVEIGWAEVEVMKEGRLEIKMTLVGTYVVGEGLAPDLAEFKGTIPAPLRKG